MLAKTNTLGIFDPVIAEQTSGTLMKHLSTDHIILAKLMVRASQTPWLECSLWHLDPDMVKYSWDHRSGNCRAEQHARIGIRVHVIMHHLKGNLVLHP